jgi:hypothetical protein
MIPYKKFVISLLFFAKDVKYILDKILSFHYYVEGQWIADIYQEVKSTLPPNIVGLLNDKVALPMQYHEWFRHYKIFEIYDYFINKEKSEYKKWVEDCLWVINNKDIMILMNILLFNNEPHDSISDIIQFKFKKKLGVDMIAMYQNLFWDCSNMDAKEAFLYCIPFRKSSLIIRELASGETEIEKPDVVGGPGDNQCDVPVTFHDINYIKWKIGYKKVSPVSAKEFLNQVKTDSMYKYYEVMHMKRFSEAESGSETGGMYGDIVTEKSRYKNVEESKAALAKKWVDIYLKVEERAPTGVNKNDEFFDRMNQTELDFGDSKEMISTVEDHVGMLEDIKGDM